MKARVSPEDLRRKLEGFIAAYPENSSVRNWWKKPLLVTAAADERFELLPHIAASGCTGRLGSLVTDADLGDAPLTGEKEHSEVCGKCQVMLPCSFGIPKLAGRPKEISATDPHGRTRTAKE